LREILGEAAHHDASQLDLEGVRLDLGGAAMQQFMDGDDRFSELGGSCSSSASCYAAVPRQRPGPVESEGRQRLEPVDREGT
jgi:hypothetical protein